MGEPEAAVAIVTSPGPEGSVLLIRRAERHDDSWSGHWSLPGGRRDPEDRDLVSTALRELSEECGIRLPRESMTSHLRPMVARRPAPPYVLVAPFVFRVDAELPTVVDPREAAEARWVPLDMLRDPLRHRLQCVPGMPTCVLFPAVRLPGAPLWGFTYRLLADWLALGPPEHTAQAAGFSAANQVLEFLLGQGMALVQGWSEPSLPHDSGVPVRSAFVTGRIPESDVLARFSEADHAIPPVNVLEVRPDCIRMVGLSFEEYFIRAES